MTRKIYVDRRDDHRILLTEVLPYEVPVVFSNASFYRFVSNGFTGQGNCPAFVKSLFGDIPSLTTSAVRQRTIPFEYPIVQGAHKKRYLAIIHPQAQILCCKLYSQFYASMTYYCSRSTASLRRPTTVSTHFYDRSFVPDDNSLIDGLVEEAGGESLSLVDHASSYFKYQKYNQLYKFIDSREFQELESQFPTLLHFDLKRCFPSIYTHSLSWALKGKEFSKDHIGAHTFEGIFDGLMQVCNNRETAGIVIGPELSRIFAEMVLQSIDVEILDAIKNGQIHCELRRYIDDYYVFAESDDDAMRIMEIAQEKLRPYRLFVNESKTELFARPFVTPQSIAKRDVLQLFNDTILGSIAELTRFCRTNGSAELAAELRSVTNVAQVITRDLKAIVGRSGVSYNVVVGLVLGSLAKSLLRLSKVATALQAHPGERRRVSNLMILVLEITFFCYSMDVRVRTTYKLVQIILIVMRVSRSVGLPSDVVQRVGIRLCSRALDSFARRSPGGVEISNILIGLRALQPELKIPAETLLYLLPEPKGGRRNYFELMTLLYYIGNEDGYGDVKEKVQLDILNAVQSSVKFACDTEAVLILVDTMSCPYLDIGFKREVCEAAMRLAQGGKPPTDEINRVINYLNGSVSFFDWHADSCLERLLMKKDFTLAY